MRDPPTSEHTWVCNYLKRGYLTQVDRQQIGNGMALGSQDRASPSTATQLR